MMSGISSGTPNKTSVSNTYNSTIPKCHRTLSVQTLRVRELCRHDPRLSLVNNKQRDLDVHIGSYIFYEDLYRLKLYVKDSYNPVYYSLCPSVCYLSKIRSSVAPYLVQYHYRQVYLLVL
ncbi:hypothetical protein D1007_52687 [Hordeum vulgare]|nr:hypothetical protein D1007_52687 [Hordeum vulgare]